MSFDAYFSSYKRFYFTLEICFMSIDSRVIYLVAKISVTYFVTACILENMEHKWLWFLGLLGFNRDDSLVKTRASYTC